MKDLKMKLFKATVKVHGEIEEVPIWAESIDTALEVADLEYGEDNVYRLHPEVTQ
ncbi:putative host RNA-polymerase inhibitor [Pseudomonas phage P413]|nr:putative host RNA-polymerase inhibitor [Pseudomonas phage P413]